MRSAEVGVVVGGGCRESGWEIGRSPSRGWSMLGRDPSCEKIEGVLQHIAIRANIGRRVGILRLEDTRRDHGNDSPQSAPVIGGDGFPHDVAQQPLALG